MIRKIIEINGERCTGCGLCAKACHEGAIEMVGGKARLAREHFCDGLGDCLPACPADAIRFVEREAPAYDEAAVRAAKAASARPQPCFAAQTGTADGSLLRNWPIQLRLIGEDAPIFDDAALLIASDCSGFACADFQRRYMDGRVTLIGCPKLDVADYAEKLCAVFRRHTVRSVLVTRMQVPCCGGLVYAVRQAIERCGRDIPLETVVLTPRGEELR